MTIAILIAIPLSNLIFLAVGFRMGRGMSPIAPAQPAWTNLKKFLGMDKEEAPPKPKELPQEKF
jgi:hypothetical protein